MSSIAVAVLLSGCAWHVLPPAKVANPEPVHITEYGRHTRLALPDADGIGFVEYGFGEWNFYGLERRGLWYGFRALAGLGEGAFSRRLIPVKAGGGFVPSSVGGLRSATIFVERKDVDALRSRLESRWQKNSAQVVVRTTDAVPVSRDAESYHLFRNSNRATADWLEELGCEIRGVPILSNFRITPRPSRKPSTSATVMEGAGQGW